MGIKRNVFFCLDCDNVFSSLEASQHPCHFPLRIVQATVTFKAKQTRWQHFFDWFLKDINYTLAFLAAIIINVLIVPHFNLSFKEELLESFCLGFVLIRLFKDKK